MWHALVIALAVAVLAVLALAALQRAEFRSVFRRKGPPPPDQLPVRSPPPAARDRDSPPAAP